MKRIFVDLSGEVSFGLGDTITLLPALRSLRKRHPKDEIVVVGFSAGIGILAYCDYIDYMLPVDILEPGEWTNGYPITMEERMDIANPTHSFMNHHKEHVIKANIRHMLLDSPEKESCDYELSIRNCDIEIIDKEKSKLIEMANGKKIIGIAPCITMYSRMWPTIRWQELTDMLRKDFFVVSLGHPEDLKINVDFDARGLYQIHHIPRILDAFEAIFLVDSGMMHIAGINQTVHMVKINTGQFGPECYTPFRNGILAYNTTVINHNCPFVRECFLGHATEVVINQQMLNCLNDFKPKNQQDSELLQKYICWNYCYKKQNKFSCNSISAKDVYAAFQKKESIIAPIEDPLPIFHEPQKNINDDFSKWKEAILVKGQNKVFVVVQSDFDVLEILEKTSLTKKLYPNHLLFLICKKEIIPIIKNDNNIFHTIPIEYLKGKIRIGAKDAFLTI